LLYVAAFVVKNSFISMLVYDYLIDN